MFAACLLQVMLILGPDKYAIGAFWFDHCLPPKRSYVCLPKKFNPITRQMMLECADDFTGKIVFDGIVQIEGPHI